MSVSVLPFVVAARVDRVMLYSSAPDVMEILPTGVFSVFDSQ